MLHNNYFRNPVSEYKRSIRLFVLLVFYIFYIGIAKADNEPDNNTPGTTTDILVPGGSSQSGSINISTDPDDYYSVTTSADGDLNVSISTSYGNLVYYELYDNDGLALLYSAYLYGGSSNFTRTGLAAGNYYVRVNAGANTNTYTVSTTLTPPPYSYDTEPNNLYTQALTLNENDSVFGHLSYRYNGGTFDNPDWYKLTTTVDGNLTIGMTTVTSNIAYFDLYDADGTTPISTNHYLYGGNASYVVNGLAAGDYYVKVYTTGNGYNSYKLSNSKTLPLYIQDTEPNGQFAQALTLNVNDSTEGHIGHYNNLARDTMDWYKIVTTQDGDLNLTITTENGNIVYYNLYDNDGSTILGGSYLYGGTKTSTINGLAAGIYYARVYATNYNSYRLRNTLTPPPYSYDTEPNNLYTQALTLNENDSVFGHLSYRYNGGTFDNPDWYKLTTTVDGNLTIGMTTVTSNIAYFDLYDADGTTPISTNHYLYGGNASYVVNGLAAGDYYVKVYTTGNGYNSYKLSNSKTLPLYNQDTEPNGQFAQALTLNVNDSTEGHIGHYNNLARDTMDWYKIVTTQDGDLNLTITTENGNIVYYNLYDNDGSTILGGSYLYGGTKTSTINGLAAGTYYVRVYATNYNSYRLRNTLSLPPYANDIEQNNTFGTAYSWNNRPSRTGHISYRENGGTYNTDDYYKITMHSAGDCSFDIQMANGNLCYFYFYNSAQTQLFTTYIYGGTYSFNFTSLAAGDYYFRVYTAGGNYNSYSVTNFSIPCNPAPAVITAGGPTTFCIPGNVTLNTQDPGEYASFLWNNSETTANITVSTSGAFSVTATDWDGCSHPSNTINVSAVSPPVASITPNGSTTFCQGGSVDLDASAGASWLWSNGATTQSINVTASGTFTVTVTNAQGCSATSAGTTVTVNPLPTVTLNPFSAVCTSDPVFALTGGSPSGGTYSGTGVSGGNFDPAAAGVGTFLITYSYTDGNGCSAQASQLITVNNCIGCVASITPGGSTTFCDGGSVMLTASAGVSYLWSTGATTQSITATTSGTYTVTVTDAFNCSATASETVTVHVLPTATISGSGAICLGNSGTVTLNFTGNGPWYYAVNGSGGPYSGVSNSNSLNLSVTPVTSGTQSYSIVSLSDVNCNGNGSGAAVFNVSSQPPTNTAKEPSAPLSACSGDVALISCNVITGQNIEYSWNTGSNSSIVKFSNNINGPFTAAPFITTVNQVYAQFGSLAPGSSGYNICLKGENGCGTTNNRCVFVRGKVTVPAGINGSAIVCSGATNQLFSVSGSLPSGVQTFIWSFSVPGAIITSLDPPLNSQVTIDFPVFSSGTLSVQSGLTCLGSSVSAARTMKINNATAIPGVMTGPSKVCPGQSYNYSVSPVAGAVNYNWVIPANASIINGAGTNSVIVEFDSSPINFVNQIIRVSAISSCSISSQPREKKVASQVPAKPGAITGITTSACDGPFTYSVPAISGVDYNWTWPAGVSNNTPNGLSSITLQFPNNFVSGAISVTGSTSGCAIQSNVRSTNVNGKPARPSSITVNMAPCNGDPGQFEASSVAGATSYTWTVPNNGTSLDQGQGQQAIDVTWGTGPGTLTVKANNGCGSSALRSYYYSPNCIMRTYSEASYTESFVVNPNPASTMATITFKSDETGSYMISLMDLSGRRVSSATVSAVEGFNSIKLDLERYAKGLYVVELRSGNQIEKAKLVIE